jgi:hypothetical protein
MAHGQIFNASRPHDTTSYFSQLDNTQPLPHLHLIFEVHQATQTSKFGREPYCSDRNTVILSMTLLPPSCCMCCAGKNPAAIPFGEPGYSSSNVRVPKEPHIPNSACHHTINIGGRPRPWLHLMDLLAERQIRSPHLRNWSTIRVVSALIIILLIKARILASLPQFTRFQRPHAMSELLRNAGG